MLTEKPNAPVAPVYRATSDRAPSPATASSAPDALPVHARADALPELQPALAHVLVPLASSRPRRPVRQFSLDEQMFVEMQHGCHG